MLLKPVRAYKKIFIFLSELVSRFRLQEEVEANDEDARQRICHEPRRRPSRSELENSEKCPKQRRNRSQSKFQKKRWVRRRTARILRGRGGKFWWSSFRWHEGNFIEFFHAFSCVFMRFHAFSIHAFSCIFMRFQFMRFHAFSIHAFSIHAFSCVFMRFHAFSCVFMRFPKTS